MARLKVRLKVRLMVPRTQLDDIAAMGVATSVAGFAPAIIAFEAGFLVLALWLRANLDRLQESRSAGRWYHRA